MYENTLVCDFLRSSWSKRDMRLLSASSWLCSLPWLWECRRGRTLLAISVREVEENIFLEGDIFWHSSTSFQPTRTWNAVCFVPYCHIGRSLQTALRSSCGAIHIFHATCLVPVVKLSLSYNTIIFIFFYPPPPLPPAWWVACSSKQGARWCTACNPIPHPAQPQCGHTGRILFQFWGGG